VALIWLVFEGDNESKIHETMRTKFPGRSFPHAKKKGKKNTKPNRREVKSWTANKNTRKRGSVLKKKRVDRSCANEFDD